MPFPAFTVRCCHLWSAAIFLWFQYLPAPQHPVPLQQHQLAMAELRQRRRDLPAPVVVRQHKVDVKFRRGGRGVSPRPDPPTHPFRTGWVDGWGHPPPPYF